MRVRKMDADGDYVAGLDAFWVDCPEGVAQIVRTRLNFWQGQDVQVPEDGTPWLKDVAGVRTQETRDQAIRARITGSPGVKRIISYSGVLNSAAREYKVTARIETDYGNALIEAAFA